MDTAVWQLAGLAVLILLSGFFSGTESAFTSLTSTQVHALQERYPILGRRVSRLMTMPGRLLSTILIGNNLVNVAAASLATVIATNFFGSYGPGIATGGLTFVILIFGEVTPKQLAITHNELVTAYTSTLILTLEFALRPLVLLVAGVSRFINRLSGGEGDRQGLTPDGILSVVRHAASVGVLTPQESWFVKNVLRFHEVSVSMIMTHRTRVFSLDRQTPLEQVLEETMDKGFSRIPVYDGDPERIVGIALVRDVVRALSTNATKSSARRPSGKKLKDVTIPAIYVPENRKIQEMLTEFRRQHQHMAIVLDEYGGLAGIVTLEDIVEEILGEIYDENELREQERIAEHSPGVWTIAGDTPLHAINEYLGTKFEYRKDVQTVGGFLADIGGHIPTQGEVIETSEGTFTIKRISRKRVLEVTFEKPSREFG